MANYDKEAFKAMKEKERNEVKNKLNVVTERVMSDVDAYTDYLKVQSHFNLYSVSNALLILEQNKDAVQLKSFDDWKAKDIKINKGEHGISLIIPTPFTDKEGNERVSYNIKKVFDRSQTNATPYMAGNKAESPKKLLVALVKNPPYPVEPVESIDETTSALFSKDNEKIFVKRGLPLEEFFESVTHEIAHASFAKNNDNYNREDYEDKAKAVTYLLGEKYGIKVKKPETVPKAWEKLESKEVRDDLSGVREVYNKMNDEIYASLEKLKAKEDRGER